MKDARISKIVIDIGNKSIEITPEQAQSLHDALNKMFGDKVVERVIERDRFPWYWRHPDKYWLSTKTSLDTSGGIGDDKTFKATFSKSRGMLHLSAP